MPDPNGGVVGMRLHVQTLYQLFYRMLGVLCSRYTSFFSRSSFVLSMATMLRESVISPRITIW